MRAYTAALISVSVASSLVLMLFAGSKYEKVLKSALFTLIALCALSPIAGLLKRDGFSEIENEVREIEAGAECEAVRSYVREIGIKCREVLTDKYPDAEFGNLEIGYEGDSSSELRIVFCAVSVTGADENELSGYLKEILGCDDIRINTEEDQK